MPYLDKMYVKGIRTETISCVVYVGSENSLKYTHFLLCSTLSYSIDDEIQQMKHLRLKRLFIVERIIFNRRKYYFCLVTTIVHVIGFPLLPNALA